MLAVLDPGKEDELKASSGPAAAQRRQRRWLTARSISS